MAPRSVHLESRAQSLPRRAYRRDDKSVKWLREPLLRQVGWDERQLASIVEVVGNHQVVELAGIERRLPFSAEVPLHHGAMQGGEKRFGNAFEERLTGRGRNRKCERSDRSLIRLFQLPVEKEVQRAQCGLRVIDAKKPTIGQPTARARTDTQAPHNFGGQLGLANGNFMSPEIDIEREGVSSVGEDDVAFSDNGSFAQHR